ncbi:hypothetical protein FHS42_003213 [Streptomyces zagrosensis]|uniref:Uncharacterized protein n=1 Tax=Streptomyces zagrosensis TaxID=1042984 RepID=A0A7W9UYN9_9ACTN|nr:hypothetical protein [Streptomyces zagrosensis]
MRISYGAVITLLVVTGLRGVIMNANPIENWLGAK